jgi:two-component system OmpR family response regulator
MEVIIPNTNSSVQKNKKVQTSLLMKQEDPFLIRSKESKMNTINSAVKEIVVFLVDDDMLFLKALEHSILINHPYLKIKTFQTGEACLQQVASKPEIVILDYYLNSTLPYAWNGLTVLKEIKKINPSTKVIMLSSQDSLDTAVKCIDNGSFDYISKSESAFVKINNVVGNIVDDIKLNRKSIRPYQIISIIIIIILTLLIIFK